MQDTTRPAQRVTRHVTILDRVDGAVIQVREHVVTVSREFVGGPITATIDGKATTPQAAYWAVYDAERVEELERVAFPAQSAALGKPRAHKLHKIMARLGMGHAEHYRFAARALGQKVESLAALTVEQARKVWAALVSAYPQAKALAA